MDNALIRGISKRNRLQIQKFAKLQNLSVNQVFLRVIDVGLEHLDEEMNKAEHRKQAFRRLRELREELRRKYGKQEDSTKLIRQMRDERSRRLA